MSDVEEQLRARLRTIVEESGGATVAPAYMRDELGLAPIAPIAATAPSAHTTAAHIDAPMTLPSMALPPDANPLDEPTFGGSGAATSNASSYGWLIAAACVAVAVVVGVAVFLFQPKPKAAKKRAARRSKPDESDYESDDESDDEEVIAITTPKRSVTATQKPIAKRAARAAPHEDDPMFQPLRASRA